MITNLLKIFDLNEKEKEVFTKLLEFGGQPASEIARLLELPRNTTRDILDRLVKKGLLTRTKKGNTQYYSIETSKNIIKFLEIKRKKDIDTLDQQIEFVEKFSDELQPHKYHRTRPKVTFYEGVDGLKRVYEDSLTSSETIRAYASLHEMYETLPGYFPEYFKRRAKKKIKIRAIFPDGEKARERKALDEKELRESALVPSNAFHFTPEINIYDNKFIIVSWKEKLAIMIESQEIADAMKMAFELSWLQAERFDEERKELKKKR
jgi:sugar-specific transcriptional regulator TrmB